MTTTASMVDCPHCQATQQTPGGFCTACGKAIPSGSSAGPRTLGANEFGSSTAARSLRSNELAAQAKKAAGALLAVAVIQGIVGILLLVAKNAGGAGGEQATLLTIMVVSQMVVAAIYLGLYFWARVSPLPAAIVGLVIFITLWLLSAIGDPKNIASGIIFKIIIIAVLVKAINAGLQFRKLSQENQGGQG